MVGVPKSTGCATCRKRSIKCDEARPSCYKCRRGGRICPGYENRMKFVDEGPRLRKNLKNTPEEARASIFPVAVNSSPMERTQVVASFIEELFPLGHESVQVSFIGNWLHHIPQALHRNAAVDQAAETLALAYFAKTSSCNSTLMRSYRTYEIALRSLSKSLQHPDSRLSSETLCATLLLLHYENFTTIRGTSWITHAGGAARLIQLRGPDRHRSGIDNAMFMASRGYIISKAMATGEACFLDDEHWNEVTFLSKSGALIPDNFRIYHEGLSYFARIPGLLARKSSLDNSSVAVRQLTDSTSHVRLGMIDWYNRLQHESEQPLRIASRIASDEVAGDETIYDYKDIMAAAFTVNYSAYRIMVNSLLDSLTQTSTNREESITLAVDICRSATYCSRGGFCGSQAMLFALPVALSILPQEFSSDIKRWIYSYESLEESRRLRWFDTSEDRANSLRMLKPSKRDFSTENNISLPDRGLQV